MQEARHPSLIRLANDVDMSCPALDQKNQECLNTKSTLVVEVDMMDTPGANSGQDILCEIQEARHHSHTFKGGFRGQRLRLLTDTTHAIGHPATDGANLAL